MNTVDTEMMVIMALRCFHSDSEQLMVDMVLVRQERVLPVAHPMQVNPDHVAARNQ